jgi:hypothetical protein
VTATGGATPEELIARLDTFAGFLGADLADDVAVERELLSDGRMSMVSITPERSGALGVCWFVMDRDEVILKAGPDGGRWELALTPENVDFLEDVTRSVIAGRAVEVFAWRRSRAEITLSDGHVARESGGVGFLSLVPLPFWPRWGRRVQYASYR